MRAWAVQIAFALGLLTASFGPARPTRGQSSQVEAPLDWPLAAPRKVTSAFGEYRSGHFHGGIDLSTEHQVGRSLRAVGDGEVWRVRASGSGYGRAVYIRLADGRTAVTAHMERFAPNLAAWVEAAQESLSRYEVDLYPPSGRLRVVRGQEIGASGESGAGPPHLHFELRSGAAAEIGLNPLRNGYSVEDSTPPIPRRLIVDALATPEALATRRGARLDVRLRATGPGSYAPVDTVRVTGAAVFALEVFDPGEGSSRAAPYRAALFLDDRLEHELRFERFDWSRAHEVELAWDPDAVAEGSHFALRLFRPVGPRDPSLQASPEGAGVLGRAAFAGDGGRSVRRFRIEVADAFGNAAQVTGHILFAPVGAPCPPEPPRSSASGEAALDTLLEPGAAFRLRLGPATLALADSSLFGPGRWRMALTAASGPEDAASPELPGVSISAPGVVLDAAMTLSLRPAPGRDNCRLALYRRNGGGGWNWVGNESGPDGVGGPTRALGRFELIEDTAPPRIAIEAPTGGAVVRGDRPTLRVRVTDDLAGVTWRTLSVAIDGVEQIVVYDPESERLSGPSRRALAPGAHRLTVRARDRVGNESEVVRDFRTAL